MGLYEQLSDTQQSEVLEVLREQPEGGGKQEASLLSIYGELADTLKLEPGLLFLFWTVLSDLTSTRYMSAITLGY